MEDIMRRKVTAGIILSILSFTLSGGDISTYVNLGFSSDGKLFLFGEYGIDSVRQKAYSDLYLVDVWKNTFVEGGVWSEVFDNPLQPGQTGLGGLITLTQKAAGLIQTKKIDHMNQGRLIYLLINGEKPKETLEFRDFLSGKQIKVNLIQNSYTSEKDQSASFYISLKVSDTSGSEKSYSVGLPDYRRKDVLSYRIKQISVSPDETSLVFVVEKEIKTDNGPALRYMVETVKL